jgi:KUP system potassium uptake protein
MKEIEAGRQVNQCELDNWQDKFFILLARSSDDASRYFHIPSGRVVEIGTQIAT